MSHDELAAVDRAAVSLQAAVNLLRRSDFRRVTLCVALIVVCGPVSGPGLAVLALGLHGVFYAATDGVLMAAARSLRVWAAGVDYGLWVVGVVV